MKKAIVYYDGFNFYHAVDELGDATLKWVNLWDLSKSFLADDEELVSVKYFSAYATWRPDAFARHRAYVKALKSAGVECILGKFKKRFPKCKKCRQTYETHEEKESDVNVAIHLVKDALTDQFDRALIVTADTDLRAAIKMARQVTNGKVIDAVAPPRRFGRSRSLKPRFEISQGKIRRSLFPERIFDDAGNLIVVRPKDYD